jgi:heme exporter protein D
MNWGSFDEFARMGGYGLYVWGSFAVTLGAMVFDAMAAVRRRRRAEAGVEE